MKITGFNEQCFCTAPCYKSENGMPLLKSRFFSSSQPNRSLSRDEPSSVSEGEETHPSSASHGFFSSHFNRLKQRRSAASDSPPSVKGSFLSSQPSVTDNVFDDSSMPHTPIESSTSLASTASKKTLKSEASASTSGNSKAVIMATPPRPSSVNLPASRHIPVIFEEQAAQRESSLRMELTTAFLALPALQHITSIPDVENYLQTLQGQELIKAMEISWPAGKSWTWISQLNQLLLALPIATITEVGGLMSGLLKKQLGKPVPAAFKVKVFNQFTACLQDLLSKKIGEDKISAMLLAFCKALPQHQVFEALERLPPQKQIMKEKPQFEKSLFFEIRKATMELGDAYSYLMNQSRFDQLSFVDQTALRMSARRFNRCEVQFADLNEGEISYYEHESTLHDWIQTAVEDSESRMKLVDRLTDWRSSQN